MNKLKSSPQNRIEKKPVTKESLKDNSLAEGVIKLELEDLYSGENLKLQNAIENGFFDHNVLSQAFDKNPAYFFDEIISIVEKNKEKDSKKVEDFLQNIKEIFFSYSPNISNNLVAEDMFFVSARINRIEEMRGFVGQNIVGEFVYTMAFANDDTVSRVIESIENQPSGLREDLVNQLETAYANALSNGSWSQEATNRIGYIIECFTRSQSPLTRVVATVARDRCIEEESNPSVGVITYANNKSAGRLNSNTNLQSLSNKIDSNLPFGYSAITVSKDVIVGVDHAGMPRFGAIDEEAGELPNQPDVGIRTAQALLYLKDYSFNQINFRNLINRLGEFWNTFEQDKEVAEFYAEILGMSKNDVKDFIDAREDITTYFAHNWNSVKKNAVEMAEKQIELLRSENKVRKVNFESFAKVSTQEDINPFLSVSKNDELLLAQCLRPEVREKLEEELGILFNDISFRSEIALLRFLSNENMETYERLLKVLHNNPANKIKIIEVFVGCSQDLEFGNEFLSLCEGSVGKELEKFLDLYSGVVMNSDSLRETILADGRAGKIDSSIMSGYLKIAIKKARAMLHDWGGDLKKARENDQEFIIGEEELARYAEQEKQSAIFASIFQQLRKEYGPEVFEVFGGFESKKADELTDKEKGDVENMYRVNYKSAPENLRKHLISLFEDRCAREGVNSFLLKDNGKVVSFLTVEDFGQTRSYHKILNKENNGGEFYIGSFNVDPNYQSASIGSAVMDNVVGKYSKEGIVHGDCSSFSSIGAKYIEDGFVATSFYEYKNNPSFEIVLDENLNKKLKTKTISKEVFVKDVLEAELKNGESVFKNYSYLVIKADTQEHIDMDMINDGMVLSRYFAYGEGDNKSWYAVFEKIN